MAITLPNTFRGPTLALELPPSTDALDVVLRNNTTGRSLVVNLPAGWVGDDLTFDWGARTVKDQTGADRSALLSPTENSLWTDPGAFLAGAANDLEIEARQLIVSSTKTPGSAASSAAEGGGAIAWTNPGNITASDNAKATATRAKELGLGNTNWLRATNPSFAIPAGTILGVGVEVERSADQNNGANAESTDYLSPRLIKGGVIQGQDRDLEGPWFTSDLVKKYGGSEDLWGLALTPSDVNAPTFGVGLMALLFTAKTAITAAVDQVRMTVWHKPTTPVASAYGAKATLRWERGYY